MRKQQILIISFIICLLIGSLTALSSYFAASSRETKRQSMISEMECIASQLVNYLHTPRRIHGGGLEIKEEDLPLMADYVKFTSNHEVLESVATHKTVKANYNLSIKNGCIELVGACNAKGNDGVNNMKVIIMITTSSETKIATKIVN
jgi:hypothetical protein